MLDVSTHWEIPPDIVLNRITENLLDNNTLIQIQTAFADAIDPWTPFLTGALHEDITIDSEGVTYEVPYAKRKYYGEAFTKEFHPLATSHWDTVAFESGAKEVFEAKVRELLKSRVKELYG